MWIESIKIKNIRSYPEATLEFSKSINIVIGENNSGKSTIIKLIDRLQGQNHGQETLTRNNESDGLVLFYINDITPNYSSVKGRKSMQKTTGPILFSLAAKKNGYRLYRSQAPMNRSKKRVDSRIDWLEFAGFPDEEPDNEIYACYSRRGFHDSQINEDNTYKIRQDMGNLAARLQLLNNGNHPRHKEFKRHCIEILGFEPGAIAQGKNMGNQFAIGIYTNNTTPIYINQMGQGVAQILALLTILCTQERKVILLEEIENDLHPKALKSLLNLIEEKSEKNQFIISTHSNIVLRQLGSLSNSRIFKTGWEMVAEKDHNIPRSTVKLISNDAESRLSVLQEMGYDVVDFDLWAGYLVFEESTCELFFKSYFIPVFFPKLIGKLCTVASKGVDDVKPRFKAFLRLFVFVHLTGVYKGKAWTIVDGDDAGVRVTNDLQTSFSDWGKDHFITLSKQDFELYYPERFQLKVSQVLAIKKYESRQAAKVSLRTEVLAWALVDKAAAKKEFEKSASEIISILTRIEKELT